MSFEMTLRYLTDSKQETTLCLIHFQKLFDNAVLKMRFENPLTLFNCRFWLVNQKKEADLNDQPLSINFLVTLG
ncbi:hypothetical protein FXE63_11885 [Vibrio mimicus]|nr:hypothetical protein FXE63_11885 [Vibrio mimicus]